MPIEYIALIMGQSLALVVVCVLIYNLYGISIDQTKQIYDLKNQIGCLKILCEERLKILFEDHLFVIKDSKLFEEYVIKKKSEISDEKNIGEKT